MTASLLRFPTDDTIFARMTERQRAANIAEERAEAIADCKRIIDNPRGYTDAQLREVCGYYMSVSLEEGGGGVHYLRADAMIFALNKREWQARNCPRPETSRDVARRFAHRWPEIVSWGALGALALLAGTGWL